ncbi:MAG TPA: glycosyltransferase family 2 protein [Melioribacteraceae bacterium]|nr:glycosyltransferase family 2 protein [Melioribacteraceae bacterium]
MVNKIEKLSAIIIAKNEEKNIERCINSLLGCIDDIVVVVDNSSTDDTLKIVNKFNVNCLRSDWLGYAKTKTLALKNTKYNWVLWIDADECLTRELKDELINLKNKETEIAAYNIARRAFFLNKQIKHCGWYPGYVTRLFNKNLCKFNDNQVHEQLIINGKIGKLKYDLEHYTDPNIKHYYNKFNTYTSLAANELNNKKRNVGVGDLILRPLFLFIKMYIIRLGFLDGYAGLILSVFSANYVFTKYAKLWELKNINDKRT